MNTESKDGKSKNIVAKSKNIIIISSILILLIIGIIGSYIISAEKKVTSWKDKIYPGVQAYGIDLGGKTKEEAINILNNELISLIGSKTIKVTVGNKNFELKYSDISPEVNASKTVEEAFQYGKNESLLNKKEIIENGVNVSVDTVLSYSEEKVNDFANYVNDKVKIDAVDASISIDGSNISVKPGSNGKNIDKDELINKIKNCIDPDPKKVEKVSVELKEYSPKVTSESLNKINGIISSYSTTFSNGDSGRVENLRIATGYINATLLMPGEEFSYNKTIGPTTPERGYKQANTYVGSKIVPDYGGGVCQVSSTLYRAIIQANIRSTERRNHSMTVGYAAPGLDATVAAGYIDYKFVNTYDFPIYIQGYLAQNKVVFNIFGNKEAMNGKRYELVNEILETYNYTTEEVDDSTLNEGVRVVTSSGSNGCKASGYLVTYENGVQVNKELISTDVYTARNKIISVGTKKEQEPIETNPNKVKQDEIAPEETAPEQEIKNPEN